MTRPTFSDRVTCPAMKEAGITDASTQAGIDFCVNKCPYSHCVIAEPLVTRGTMRRVTNKRAARILRSKGANIAAIAAELNISVSSVKRFLA